MYNPDMIIYGELLVIENMIIGWVLLYLTGEICRQKCRRWRLAAGSIMCGAFSLVVFLDWGELGVAKVPVMLLMEVAFAAAVCTVALGKWKHAVVFILVTYFMGGITMGLLLLTKQQGIYTVVGIYTGDMKAAMLAVFIWIGYMTTMQIIDTVRNKKLQIKYSYDVQIAIGNERIETRAFLDTGNKLKDPLTGKPVAVASEKLWGRLVLENERFALIPYESVGSKGMLQAVRSDHMDIAPHDERDGRNTDKDVAIRHIKGCLIARGETVSRFEFAGTCELLISTEMVEAEWD